MFSGPQIRVILQLFGPEIMLNIIFVIRVALLLCLYKVFGV